MTSLDEWTASACRALALDPTDVDLTMILDLARDAAHHVQRPAAPLTTYLLGIAVGRGADPKAAAALLHSTLAAWPGPADG
ncbi:DUF6457 domain-containing protein [Luedemannella helvata]|uniref:DUF6457 domain-containing protein n=1 Tax=Luedemannella helvata TaxID=349315 RepID=A0ABP4X434_9ACTN